MDLRGIGYSNIRLPNDSKNYIYTYNPLVNVFPEEVFIHEFLHSLERICNEYEYEIPELHDNLKYGYEEQKLIGLKNWYADYMTCNIKDFNGNSIGLNSKVYSLKPIHESNFKYSTKIEFSKESKNLIEKIKIFFSSITN